MSIIQFPGPRFGPDVRGDVLLRVDRHRRDSNTCTRVQRLLFLPDHGRTDTHLDSGPTSTPVPDSGARRTTRVTDCSTKGRRDPYQTLRGRWRRRREGQVERGSESDERKGEIVHTGGLFSPEGRKTQKKRPLRFYIAGGEVRSLRPVTEPTGCGGVGVGVGAAKSGRPIPAP